MRRRPLKRVLDPHWQPLLERPMRSLRGGAPRAGVPELVLVPGLGALGYLVPTVLACAAWTRVHLLDAPGFGHRSTARCTPTVAATAQAVSSWLDVSFDRPVLLMGHSTGAQVAVRSAVDVPDRVGSLCLAGPTFPPAARRWRGLAGSVARALPHEHPGVVPAITPEYLRGKHRLPRLLRDAMDDTPEHLVAQVEVPLLVLVGRRDAVSPPSWGADLASRARQGRLVDVAAGHNFPFTHPVTTSTAVRAVLGRSTVS